jgi:hypothetical protein|nr:hypothetical protein [uncultured Noviherbaspirillum sp.]
MEEILTEPGVPQKRSIEESLMASPSAEGAIKKVDGQDKIASWPSLEHSPES